MSVPVVASVWRRVDWPVSAEGGEEVRRGEPTSLIHKRDVRRFDRLLDREFGITHNLYYIDYNRLQSDRRRKITLETHRHVSRAGSGSDPERSLRTSVDRVSTPVRSPARNLVRDPSCPSPGGYMREPRTQDAHRSRARCRRRDGPRFCREPVSPPRRLRLRRQPESTARDGNRTDDLRVEFFPLPRARRIERRRGVRFRRFVVGPSPSGVNVELVALATRRFLRPRFESRRRHPSHHPWKVPSRPRPALGAIRASP